MSEEAGDDFCTEVIRYIQAHDPTLQQMHDAIPAHEQEYTDDMADLLATLDPGTTLVQILRRAAVGFSQTPARTIHL